MFLKKVVVRRWAAEFCLRKVKASAKKECFILSVQKEGMLHMKITPFFAFEQASWADVALPFHFDLFVTRRDTRRDARHGYLYLSRFLERQVFFNACSHAGIVHVGCFCFRLSDVSVTFSTLMICLIDVFKKRCLSRVLTTSATRSDSIECNTISWSAEGIIPTPTLPFAPTTRLTTCQESTWSHTCKNVRLSRSPDVPTKTLPRTRNTLSTDHPSFLTNAIQIFQNLFLKIPWLPSQK